MNAQGVIIEVDPGIDDAYALAVLVAAHQMGIVHIIAIVCSAGNAIRHQTCYNLVKIMTVLNVSTEIPIFEGGYRPILRDQEFIESYGADGFGDLCITKDPYVQLGTTEQFCKFMDMIARPHSVVLMVFAPLTFTCSFLMQNTNAMFKEIWIMGGNSIGDCIAQSSFKRDPEAADCVFQHAGSAITLVPLQVTQSAMVAMHWRLYDLGSISNPFMKLMNEAERNIIADRNDWVMSDAVMAVTFAFPDIVKSSAMFRITIGRNYPTDPASGLVIPDTDNPELFNVRLISSVNVKLYQSLLTACITGTIPNVNGRVQRLEPNVSVAYLKI